MKTTEADSLWLRHLAGERLQPWEEQRLLRFLEEDPELKDAVLRDHEMDGLLRALDHTRRPKDPFVRDVRSLVAAEKDRTRFMSRFRDRLKREVGTRANTTRRIAGVRPGQVPGPKIALIAAELLVGVFLLWAALSSAPERPKPAPAPQVRRPLVWEPDAPRVAPAPDEAPKRPSEPAPLEAPKTLPAPPEPAPAEPARVTLSGRHDTMPALAVLERVDGDVYLMTPEGLSPARIGHDLMPGQGLATVGRKSRATVKYPDSTRFQIRGDTIVRELAEGPGKRVVLTQGRFSIQVARQPAEAPMEIVTPAARITVVGTRFSVACDPDATRVMVDEGRVRLTPLPRGEAVEAGAGEAAGASAERAWSARPLRAYALPTDWKGSKAESAQGNPYRVDSRPTWRLDQIWPDDPLKVENYTPLVWSGRLWHASEQSSGGQPSADPSETALGLGVRMWWPDQLGNKLSSLAFVAPADGLYAVEGSVRTEIWEGGTQKPLLLQVLKLDRKEKQVSSLASIPMSAPRLLELNDLVVPLKAQQELIFLPQFPERGHVACTYLFEGLKIVRLTSKN